MNKQTISSDQTNLNQDAESASQTPFMRRLRRIFKFTWKTQKLTQTRKAIVLNDLVDSSLPGTDYFVLIILSCTIATFGLLSDSASAVIGAMLIDPLLSPILGLSMSSISGLSRLFRRSLFGILQGAGLAIFLSSVIAFLFYRLPFGLQAQIPGEVLARTGPSTMDLSIALAGGAAAAYALAHPRLTAALPGVAIATALMPPLCTIGFGIALTDTSIILGAFLLFITNMVAISFAGIVTFALMGFSARDQIKIKKLSQSLSISAILVVAISLLLAVLGWNTISEARLYNQAKNVIIESVSQYTQVKVEDLSIATESNRKHITATLRTTHELSNEEMVEIQSDLSESLNSPVSLELMTIPMQVFDIGTSPDS